MRKIFFQNIHIENSRINIDLITEDELNIKDILFFNFSEEINVTENVLAVALSTLCGKKYDYIYMDLIISRDIYKFISKYTDSHFEVKEINNNNHLSNTKNNMEKISLLFSGGFDSLAAYSLLQNQEIMPINLLSLNFEGNFSREKDFFKFFSPIIINTNFVSLGLNKNSMSFMYIASILCSDSLNLKYNIIGDIFETENHLYGRDVEKILEIIGVKAIPLVLGLTEIGTGIVVSHFHPELVHDSLCSLANSGEAKRFRKQLIIKVISKRFNKKIFFNEDIVKNKYVWGTSLSEDFLSFYFIKQLGITESSKFIEGIPKEIVSIVKFMSLDFYEKYNTSYLNEVPNNLIPILLKRLSLAGIYPYNKQDFLELNLILNILKKYHEKISINNFNQNFLNFEFNDLFCNKKSIHKKTKLDENVILNTKINFKGIKSIYKNKFLVFQLVDENNQFLDNKKLICTLNIKDILKTYILKTDHNGIALLQINLKKGNYKGSCSFGGYDNLNPHSLDNIHFSI